MFFSKFGDHMKKYLILIILITITGMQVLFSQNIYENRDIDRLVERGIKYERENNLHEAVKIYRQIIQLDETNFLANIRLAKLLSWTENTEEAMIILDRLEKNYPENSETYFRKAQILSWKKEYDKSISYYNKFLEMENDDLDGLMGLGRVYFWAGKYNKAIEYFNKTIELNYSVTESRLNLAKIYFNMNDSEKAEEILLVILENDPENPEAKELYATLPQFMKFEASPAVVKMDFYEGGAFGIKLSPFLNYRISKIWDLRVKYDFLTTEGISDSIFSAGATFNGIKNLALSADISAAVDPELTEALKITGQANYSINRNIGAGLAVENLVFKDINNPVQSNENLTIMKPSFSYYFTDISYTSIQYIQYMYSSGFKTSAVSLNINLEYYNKNSLSFAVTYGGDYESMDEDRNLFEAGGGISYLFTNNFQFGIGFTHIESEYSTTNQLTIIPVIRW